MSIRSPASDDSVADGNYAFELFYNFQVTDNISLTPAVHYFSRPLGETTSTDRSDTFQQLRRYGQDHLQVLIVALIFNLSFALS